MISWRIHVEIEELSLFISIDDEYGVKCDQEMRSSIGIARSTFNAMKPLLISRTASFVGARRKLVKVLCNIDSPVIIWIAKI